MSDNEDLLADDLGDHSLADYNLGNDEEDQLLADDYESGLSQNVPSSVAYQESVEAPPQFSEPEGQYPKQRIQYHLQPDTGESVVPNITVEVPNVAERPSYAPYEPPVYREPAPAVLAAPIEAPQIVPSEQPDQPRERFISERPVGAQRLPQQRDIPDSLDKVVVPGRGPPWGRGRTSWRSPQYHQRFRGHYQRNHVYRGNFNQRPQFPPPQKARSSPPQNRPEIRPNPLSMRPEIRPDLPPNLRPDIPPNIPPNSMGRPRELGPPLRPDLPPNMRPDILPNMPPRPDLPPGRPDLPEMREPGVPGLGPDLPLRPDFRPELRPDLPPHLPQEGHPPEGLHPNMPLEPPFRPMERFRFQNYRDERPFLRPNFDPFYRPFRPFPPMREVAPNMNQIPQVTIRHGMPNLPPNMPPNMGPGMGPQMGPVIQQEVRMLPVQLPPVPAGALAGKKVLINPHFKGNFQPPVEGLSLPAYIPTRIQKTPPPLSPTLESKFGPVKDIDDAAERFIAEQRNALARAATRKFPPRRSPPPRPFVEKTLEIEIENELARPPARRRSEDDLLRRQEEFINANRAGLRRRMRSPTPPRRSPSPPARRSPPPAHPAHPADRSHAPRAPSADSDYRRRMREQEALRERVTRAKEARRRRNATQHRTERRDPEPEKEKERPPPRELPKPDPGEPVKPDTTRTSPEKQPEQAVIDRSPVGKEEAEVNSTCDALTPPRAASPALTPPLPAEEKRTDSDDDLDLILEDIDGILSDDDDTGRFKDKSSSKPPPPKPSMDLRTKLPPKPAEKRPARKPIVFEDKEQKRRKERSPQRKAVSSSTKEESRKEDKARDKPEPKAKESKSSMRQRITFDKKEAQKVKNSPPKEREKDGQKTQFSNRRVILQRKIQNEKSVFTRIEVKADPTKPNPGIFSRAVRTAIGNDKSRIVINKKNAEPEVEFESDSEDEEKLLNEDIGSMALVTNLPHGMTDTRLKTLAGNDVQTLTLDKEDRSAKVTFKTTVAAENFKKKFNNKMVAASRLTVVLR